jgi:hypothetical protein
VRFGADHDEHRRSRRLLPSALVVLQGQAFRRVSPRVPAASVTVEVIRIEPSLSVPETLYSTPSRYITSAQSMILGRT